MLSCKISYFYFFFSFWSFPEGTSKAERAKDSCFHNQTRAITDLQPLYDLHILTSTRKLLYPAEGWSEEMMGLCLSSDTWRQYAL